MQYNKHINNPIHFKMVLHLWRKHKQLFINGAKRARLNSNIYFWIFPLQYRLNVAFITLTSSLRLPHCFCTESHHWCLCNLCNCSCHGWIWFFPQMSTWVAIKETNSYLISTHNTSFQTFAHSNCSFVIIFRKLLFCWKIAVILLTLLTSHLVTSP